MVMLTMLKKTGSDFNDEDTAIVVTLMMTMMLILTMLTALKMRMVRGAFNDENNVMVVTVVVMTMVRPNG